MLSPPCISNSRPCGDVLWHIQPSIRAYRQMWFRFHIGLFLWELPPRHSDPISFWSEFHRSMSGVPEIWLATALHLIGGWVFDAHQSLSAAAVNMAGHLAFKRAALCNLRRMVP